ncbi:unnamed protein product [Adineta ricciae]|uniref:Uncharacterized protein n=1 Tax=Adineta ricciae TaxID=249248 RepID=A0A814TKN7_ADIRI|nr:unnamed protein product [Adineta ricciae]
MPATSVRCASSVGTNEFKKVARIYLKYAVLTVGGLVTCQFAYGYYKWTVKVPICPNYDRNQNINMNNVLACTALVQNRDKQCSGEQLMVKVGAVTGVNFKLSKSQTNSSNPSTNIFLSDDDMIEKNIFQEKYALTYFETVADLIVKLDEPHLVNLLSNRIGYYVFICPICHSSLTRQMPSCTSYLHQAGLEKHAADISEMAADTK